MTYRRSYRSRRPAEPRWLDAKYPGTCRQCEQPIAAGQRAYWWPASRTLTCTEIPCAAADGLTETVWHGSPISGHAVEVLAERSYRADTYDRDRGSVTTTFSSGATSYRNRVDRAQLYRPDLTPHKETTR